jgi:fibronectin type 3 domain-containing protein
MAKRHLPLVLLLAMTVAVAACGGGDDPPPTSSASSTSSAPSTTPPPAQSPTSLRLNWNANTETDLAGYRIYRSTTSGIYGAPVATAPANATSFVAAGLKPGVTYFFTITAVDTAGNESVKSNQVIGSL